MLLPPELQRIHDVFHVSMLRKYRSDPSHVMPVQEIELNPDLSYDEELIEILASDSKILRVRTIELVKVKWRHRGVEEATWERKNDMKEQYPYLFPPGYFGDVGSILEKHGKSIWEVRTRNWKLWEGENRLSGLLEGTSVVERAVIRPRRPRVSRVRDSTSETPSKPCPRP
ncbi:hypothetical protein V6N11_073066 [Hibiscus sabdariffa]|uniref:Receptor-like protein kinase n=1 Tax=Hibiscus sabdariffa TaxID=183260 RepID=A0ABR2NX88_9ROSI